MALATRRGSIRSVLGDRLREGAFLILSVIGSDIQRPPNQWGAVGSQGQKGWKKGKTREGANCGKRGRGAKKMKSVKTFISTPENRSQTWTVTVTNELKS